MPANEFDAGGINGAIQRSRGFSLIELVAGLVLTAFSLTFLSVVFFSHPERSVEPMLQVRAAELGQALMDEILAKPFDEQTPLGGFPPCSPCTPTASLGPDGTETRSNYNDVDDYHSYCDSNHAVEDVFGNLPTDFDNFQMSICVNYDGDYNGVADDNINAKLVIVEIYPPSGAGLHEPITFKAYRGNF